MPEQSARVLDTEPVPARRATVLAPVPPVPMADQVREPSTDGAGADELPDPAPLGENLARCVLEVLAGVRDVDQLARWLSEDVYRHLLRRAQHAARARRARRAPDRRPSILVRRVLVQRTSPGVAEIVAVVDTGARVRAIAIRLEAFDGRRWRAQGVHVL